MSGPPPEPLFLAQQSYRRRRIGDAARILPWAGAIAFALPVLWAGQAQSAASDGLYVFAVWSVLICAAAFVSRILGRAENGDTDGG